MLNGKYKENKEKLIEVNDFIPGQSFEIEDLIPFEIIIRSIDRAFRETEFFEDFYTEGEPIVNQIDAWAKENNIDLQNGWKVDLSREILNKGAKHFPTIKPDTEKIWMALFEKLSED